MNLSNRQNYLADLSLPNNFGDYFFIMNAHPPFHIRLAEAKDAIGILEIYAPYILHTAVSFELEVPSEQEMATRIESTMPHHPWLVCTQGKKVVGYAYAGLHRKREAYQWATEVSAYVHPDFRKQKIGTALYHVLLKCLKLQGFTTVYAGATLPNPASLAFHKTLGFEVFARYEKVGFKFEKWRSTAWMQMDWNPDELPPTILKTVPEIQSTFDWDALVMEGLQFIQVR